MKVFIASHATVEELEALMDDKPSHWLDVAYLATPQFVSTSLILSPAWIDSLKQCLINEIEYIEDEDRNEQGEPVKPEYVWGYKYEGPDDITLPNGDTLHPRPTWTFSLFKQAPDGENELLGLLIVKSDDLYQGT